MYNIWPFDKSYNRDGGEAGWERMVEVRSHHTGGKTSSTILPKITSPGVVAARPEHPLPGPKHGTHTHTHTHLSHHTDSAVKVFQPVMCESDVCYLSWCLQPVFMTTRRPGDIFTRLLRRDNHFGDFRASATKDRSPVRVVCAVKNENRAVFLVFLMVSSPRGDAADTDGCFSL